MRGLLWVSVLALLGWSGWWWFASDTAEKAARGWFAARQAEGWQASHGGIGVQGFPSRIDLTIDTPDIAPPQGGWRWQAPFVQVLSLSYKPWHLIAAFANDQRLETPAGPLMLASDKLQASLVLVPGTDLALDRFQLAGDALRLTGAADLGITHLSVATRQAVGLAMAHDLGIEAQGITPPAALLASLPAGSLPVQIPLMRLDATVTLSAPLDRHAGQTRPQMQRIALREARLDWGDIRAHVSGEMGPDAAGFAEGRLDLRLEGAAKALDLAVATGLIAPESRANWQTAITALAPTGQALTLPLQLAGGRMLIGPIPVGPAPRLR